MSENQPTNQGKLNTYRMLLPLLGEQRLLIIGWLFFLAISSAATLTLPAAARFMIDRGFGQTDPQLLNAGFMGLFVVAMVMAAAGALDASALNLNADSVAVGAGAMGAVPAVGQVTVEEAEKRMVRQALEKTGGNIQRAATLLGLSRPALYRRMEKYGIE
mgnify:CR=1 FL=1